VSGLEIRFRGLLQDSDRSSAPAVGGTTTRRTETGLGATIHDGESYIDMDVFAKGKIHRGAGRIWRGKHRERQRQRITAEAQRKAKDLTQRPQRKTGEHRERRADRRSAENAEETGRDPSAGLKQRRRPQDDDACRIVRRAKSTGKIACATMQGAEKLTAWRRLVARRQAALLLVAVFG